MDQIGLKTFNGGEQIIIKPLLTDLYNSFTYEFWVKPYAEHKIDEESLTGGSGLIGKNYLVAPGHGQLDNQAGIGISIGRNGVSIYEHTAFHLPATLVHPVLIDGWTHIGVVYDEKTPYLFINGNFIKKGLTSTMNILYASGIFGGFAYGYFKGEICNLRVWSYARTETEIKAGMNGKIDENEYGLYINEYFEIMDNTSDVLFMFGHYRQDLEYLLFPVANSLVKKGLSVSMLIENKYSPNLSMLSSEVNIIYLDQFKDKFNISQRANEYYQVLLKNTELHPFYKTYSVAIDRSYSTILLNIIRPKCIYGIHFVTAPGCINAIKSLYIQPKVVLIQHGVLMYNSIAHDYNGADLVFLWGDWDKRLLNQMDNAPPNIVIGNPKIEQIRKDVFGKNKILSKKKETGNTNLKILYIFAYSPKMDQVRKENERMFIEGISQIRNIEVIFKLHPGSPPDYLQEYLLKGIIRPEQILKFDNIIDLIEQANIVVGDYSTAIYEAAALNKPVIKICHSIIEEKLLKFHYVKTPQELIIVIKKLQDDPQYFNEYMEKQDEYLNDLFYKIDGSSDRIADYIHNQLIKNI